MQIHIHVSLKIFNTESHIIIKLTQLKTWKNVPSNVGIREWYRANKYCQSEKNKQNTSIFDKYESLHH